MAEGPGLENLADYAATGKPPKNGAKASGQGVPHPFTARELQLMVLPPIEFIIPGLLPEGLTILAGKPKIGKSLLVLAICVAVASGGFAFGTIKVPKGEVLYLALEDNRRRLKKRLHDLLGDMVWPEGLYFETEWPRLDAKALAYIRAWLDEKPTARMVVIDTLAKIRPGRKNSAGYQEDYSDMEGLQSLAGERRMGVIVVHHARKQESEDALDDVSGTLGLSGGSDGTWIMKQKSRATREATLTIVHRDLEENQEIALLWDGLLKTWKEIGSAAALRLSKERQEIIDLVRSASRGMSPSQVASDLHKNAGTVRKLMAEMLKDGHLSSPYYGVYQAFSPEPSETPGNTGNSSGNSSAHARSDTTTSGNTGNTGNSSPVQGHFVPESGEPRVTGGVGGHGNSDPASERQTPRVTTVTGVTAHDEKEPDEDPDWEVPF